MSGAGALPTLFGYFRSSCSYRVRIGLNHKGIQYKLQPINLLKAEHRDAAFLKRNPLGMVPALDIDGNVLSQSVAILEYLEETRPHSPLLPQDPISRARVRQICQLICADIQPIQNLSVMVHAGSLAGRDEAKAEWSRHYIRRGFDALERTLAVTAGSYCVGDNFTLADVCLAPQVYSACRFGVKLAEEYPRIAAVYARCIELPAVLEAHPHAQLDCPMELRGTLE